MGRPGGESTYFRISPRPIDQQVAPLPEAVAASTRGSLTQEPFAAHSRTPIVTVLDGHPHPLAFLAATDLIADFG
jgi:hypothetical protein